VFGKKREDSKIRIFMAVYIICYDIVSDKKRGKAAKYLEKRGNRVQDSVFEVYIQSKEELLEIRESLLRLMSGDEEIRFYKLPSDPTKSSFGLNGEKIGFRPSAIIL
jgi:CRISPR-associated protein Cas2